MATTTTTLSKFTRKELAQKYNILLGSYKNIKKEFTYNSERSEDGKEALSKREKKRLDQMKEQLFLINKAIKNKDLGRKPENAQKTLNDVKTVASKLSSKVNLVFGLEHEIKNAATALEKGQNYAFDGKKKKEAAEQLIEFAKSVNSIGKKLVELKKGIKSVEGEEVDKYLEIAEESLKMADAIVQIRNTDKAKAFMKNPTNAKLGYEWAMDAADSFDAAWTIVDTILTRMGADKIPMIAVPLKHFKMLFKAPKVFVGTFVDILKTRDKQLKNLAGLSMQSGTGHVGTNGEIIDDIPSEMARIYAGMYNTGSEEKGGVSFSEFIKKNKGTLEKEDEDFGKSLKILLGSIKESKDLSDETKEAWRMKILSIAAKKI